VSPRGIPARKGKDKARDREEDEDSGWRVELEEQNGQAEVLERWMNLAPVKDFAVIEEEGRGAVSIMISEQVWRHS
jgi:DNA damage-binding protein 1